MTKLAYTTCTRPAMTYASFAFAFGLPKKLIAKLNSVQSLALRMTCNARKGTPLNGLEVILDIPPIDLFMKAEATKSTFRLIGTSEEVTAAKGHVKTGNMKLLELNLHDIPRDNINKALVWDKKTIALRSPRMVVT